MFLDQDNAENTMELLRLGTATPFWQAIQESIDESIAHLQKVEDSQEMRDLPAEQYKLESELLKAKKKYLNHLKQLPMALVEYLKDPPNNQETKNDDPFYNEEELAAELSKPGKNKD